jgi:hypothetical protein
MTKKKSQQKRILRANRDFRNEHAKDLVASIPFWEYISETSASGSPKQSYKLHAAFLLTTPTSPTPSSCQLRKVTTSFSLLFCQFIVKKINEATWYVRKYCYLRTWFELSQNNANDGWNIRSFFLSTE